MAYFSPPDQWENSKITAGGHWPELLAVLGVQKGNECAICEALASPRIRKNRLEIQASNLSHMSNPAAGA